MYEIIIDKGDCKYKLKIRILTGDEWRGDCEYRRTEYDKRDDFIKNKYLEYLTQDDIDCALNQVYEKLLPRKENTNYFL